MCDKNIRDPLQGLDLQTGAEAGGTISVDYGPVLDVEPETQSLWSARWMNGEESWMWLQQLKLMNRSPTKLIGTCKRQFGAYICPSSPPSTSPTITRMAWWEETGVLRHMHLLQALDHHSTVPHHLYHHHHDAKVGRSQYPSARAPAPRLGKAGGQILWELEA